MCCVGITESGRYSWYVPHSCGGVESDGNAEFVDGDKLFVCKVGSLSLVSVNVLIFVSGLML